MTTATASNAVFSGGALRVSTPAAKAPLRLLPAKAVTALAVPLALHAPVRNGAPPGRHAETLGLIALVAALHGVGAWAVINRQPVAPAVPAPQEIELIRPPVEEPEPPKPIEPPKPVIQPKAEAPPPALRTQAAEAPVPNTMTVAENLTATPSAGPVVAAPPAPPAPPARAEEPVTEANGAAAYLNNPPPVYPRAAQRLGLQGRVILRVRVLANGHVGSVEIKDSSGKALLDDAALTAVKAWVFTPAKRGSTAIDGWTQVPIEFKLS